MKNTILIGAAILLSTSLSSAQTNLITTMPPYPQDKVDVAIEVYEAMNSVDSVTGLGPAICYGVWGYVSEPWSGTHLWRTDYGSQYNFDCYGAVGSVYVALSDLTQATNARAGWYLVIRTYYNNPIEIIELDVTYDEPIVHLASEGYSASLTASGATSPGSTLQLEMGGALSPFASGRVHFSSGMASLPVGPESFVVDAQAPVYGTIPLAPGTQSVSVSIPSDPALVGLELVLQGEFNDPGGAGWVQLSNGIVITIG